MNRLLCLKGYSISPDSYLIVTKLGIDMVTELVNKNMLLTFCREECHRWLNANQKLKRQIEDLLTENRYDCDGDIDIMIGSITFCDLVAIMEAGNYGQPPKFIKTIVDIAKKESPFSFNDYSFIGVLFDYLREINAYINYANLAS